MIKPEVLELLEPSEDRCVRWIGEFRNGPVLWNGAGDLDIRRHIWEDKYGPLDFDLLITTTCMKARCLNPEHLKTYKVTPYTKQEKARVNIELRQSLGLARKLDNH